MTIMRSRTGNPGSDPLMSERDLMVLREFEARNGDIGSVAEFAKQLDLPTAKTRAFDNPKRPPPIRTS